MASILQVQSLLAGIEVGSEAVAQVNGFGELFDRVGVGVIVVGKCSAHAQEHGVAASMRLLRLNQKLLSTIEL